MQDWRQADLDVPHLTGDEHNECCDGLFDRETWLAEAITALPARTAAGLAVKARVLARAHDCGSREHDDLSTWAAIAARGQDDVGRAVGSLVADLLHIAQELAQ